MVRHGLQMLSEWDGCDGARGRKQQQERCNMAVPAGPSTAELFGSHLCSVKLVPANTTRSRARYETAASRLLAPKLHDSSSLCFCLRIWVFVCFLGIHVFSGAPQVLEYLGFDRPSAAFCGNIFMGSEKHYTP